MRDILHFLIGQPQQNLPLSFALTTFETTIHHSTNSDAIYSSSNRVQNRVLVPSLLTSSRTVGINVCFSHTFCFPHTFCFLAASSLLQEAKRNETTYKSNAIMHSSTLLVSILPTLSVAHLSAHHAMKPQLTVLESPNRIPIYEAPRIQSGPPDSTPSYAQSPKHVHVVTRTITRTTQATTTLISTTLPPLLSPTSISLYQTSSLTSSESLSFHEDLKIKRDQTPTPTGTHTPLFTGHGPVQPGATFNVQGQSMTLLSGSLVKVTGTGTASVSGKTVSAGVSGSKTASASASKATSSSGAGVVAAGVGSLGIWGVVMVLAGMVLG